MPTISAIFIGGSLCFFSSLSLSLCFLKQGRQFRNVGVPQVSHNFNEGLFFTRAELSLKQCHLLRWWIWSSAHSSYGTEFLQRQGSKKNPTWLIQFGTFQMDLKRKWTLSSGWLPGRQRSQVIHKEWRRTLAEFISLCKAVCLLSNN